MKQTRNNIKLLYFIFLITVIPTIIVYAEHGYIELKESGEAVSDTKKTKTLAESIFFTAIGMGYVILTLVIIIAPKYRIPYIVLIIGTIAIVIFYYLSRIYPVPIPFTDVVIRDVTMDWRDVITKICQQIMVVPLTILAIRRES